jgi:hypothetical protein
MDKSKQPRPVTTSQSGQDYVPRIQAETQEDTKSFFVRFKEYFDTKLKFKSFRMKMLSEFQRYESHVFNNEIESKIKKKG